MTIDTPAKFKAARTRLGLTQDQMADAIGMHRSAIQMMEYGTKPIRRRTDLAVRYLLANPPPQT